MPRVRRYGRIGRYDWSSPLLGCCDSRDQGFSLHSSQANRRTVSGGLSTTLPSARPQKTQRSSCLAERGGSVSFPLMYKLYGSCEASRPSGASGGSAHSSQIGAAGSTIESGRNGTGTRQVSSLILATPSGRPQRTQCCSVRAKATRLPFHVFHDTPMQLLATTTGVQDQRPQPAAFGSRRRRAPLEWQRRRPTICSLWVGISTRSRGSHRGPLSRLAPYRNRCTADCRPASLRLRASAAYNIMLTSSRR
jgi:hypothetical protein